VADDSKGGGQNQLPLDQNASYQSLTDAVPTSNTTPGALPPTPGSTTWLPPSRTAFKAEKLKGFVKLTNVINSTLELEAEPYRLESLKEQAKLTAQEDREELEHTRFSQVPNSISQSF
jgi:hypothetical protein